jgi:hypothetical protein
MTYGYQWQRCDSGGASCAAVAGATSANYALVAADVGSRLRVSVTASNSYGSTAAASDATQVVSGLPSDNPYYSEHFDNAYNNGFWSDKLGGVNTFIADGWLNQGRRVTDCASPSATQHCSGSGSNYGQEGGLNAQSLPNEDRPHTGRIPGSGSNCCDGNGAGGVGTWYRFHVRFPTGYQPTPGSQNTVWEVHVDGRSESQGTPYSTLIGVQGQGTACAGSPPFCDHAGTQPRFFFQVPGGSLSSPPTLSSMRWYPFALNSLQINHWYDIVVHVNWSDNSTDGWFQCWIDGSLALDVHTPTLYRRSDGTLSYGQSVGLYDYRLWANFAAAVDFDEMLWGPTAASVGVS